MLEVVDRCLVVYQRQASFPQNMFGTWWDSTRGPSDLQAGGLLSEQFTDMYPVQNNGFL